MNFKNSAGVSTGYSISPSTAVDWYDQQTLGLNTPIFWNTIAGKPVDSNFSDSRSGGNDSLHIVVVDDSGSVTGIQGNILEKHTFLSKAKDATADGEAPTKTYYKDYLTNGSNYIFAGYSPSNAADAFWGTSPAPGGFSSNTVPNTVGAGQWGQDAQGVVFSAIGNKSYALSGGVDYSTSGGHAATLGGLQTSYQIFANDADVEVNFLLMGPGFPWFSPAGAQRGTINDAIKLAYNPSKSHRDQLYGSRINPIINKKGLGIILFGDKTALGYSSAFDRINVRRLFLTVEQAIESAADAQLFELNDSTTRANFVNAIEPFLRDVQAKRGIFDFVVKCDDTNNTPDIIDNNEFRADIFLKPTKSINYVTLTFVATRSGVDFSEVVGTV